MVGSGIEVCDSCVGCSMVVVSGCITVLVGGATVPPGASAHHRHAHRAGHYQRRRCSEHRSQ
jgi:hypothetical protein